jgi:serine/threonine protein phosphatase 1
MARLASWIDSLLNRSERAVATPLPRLSAAERPALIYAIGDVHGCLDALKALEARIVADAADTPGEKWIVMLGDYVDRGLNSAGVLDHLIARPPAGFSRICLRGNHDEAMLAALEDSRSVETWIGWGVETTLASYGLGATQIAELAAPGRASAKQQLLQAYIPDEHIAFLRNLPVILTVPGYIFVHAGLRPGVEPALQRDRDLMWIRDEFLNTDHDFGATVIHGHTPVDHPYVSPHHISIDTACYASGVLTAVRVDASGVRVVG